MHLKKLWKKEKMLVTSIFSFSHNVFEPVKDKLLSLGPHLKCHLSFSHNVFEPVKDILVIRAIFEMLSADTFNLDQCQILFFGKDLTLPQTSPGFYVSFENTVGKGEIARNTEFLLFPQRFLHFWRTFCHFKQS